MRIFEIILKIAFFGGSIYAIKSEVVGPIFLFAYLTVCWVLGIVLIFNTKHPSYNFKQSKKDIIMRRIEGSLLVVFAVFVYVMQG